MLFGGSVENISFISYCVCFASDCPSSLFYDECFRELIVVGLQLTEEDISFLYLWMREERERYVDSWKGMTYWEINYVGSSLPMEWL